MILENKYDEIMKKIEVTAKMEERILNRLQNLDGEHLPKKANHFPNYKKLLSLAACFLFLLIGSVITYNYMQPEDNNPPILATPDIADFETIEQLSKAVGFTVKEITELPFIAEQINFNSYWNELAEIVYQDTQYKVMLRMSKGNEDVSGDYSEYSHIKEVVLEGSRVTLKGNGLEYQLAIWQRGDYSYSIRFVEPVAEQVLLTAVKSVR